MYGLTGKEVDTLSHRWTSCIKLSADNKFKSYSHFLEWSKKSGYAYGKLLVKKDPHGPFSPQNCQWIEKPLSPETMKNLEECIKKWDDFVTLIRERLKDYKPPENPCGKEYFRYEHPDLVREGIIWMP